MNIKNLAKLLKEIAQLFYFFEKWRKNMSSGQFDIEKGNGWLCGKDKFDFVSEVMLNGLKYKDVKQDLDEESGKIRFRMETRQLTKNDILNAIVKTENEKTYIVVVAKDAKKHVIEVKDVKIGVGAILSKGADNGQPVDHFMLSQQDR